MNLLKMKMFFLVHYEQNGGGLLWVGTIGGRGRERVHMML
jgi:hypothetical protein